jgi:hypothetical protein
MDIIDTKRLALPGGSKVYHPSPSQKPPRHKPGGKFLKGPIPWEWVTISAKLPGKALQVGMVIWFLAGIKNSRTVALSGKTLEGLGVSRYAGYRGLKGLEEANLVTVNRHTGRNPIVTILASEEMMAGPQDEYHGSH